MNEIDTSTLDGKIAVMMAFKEGRTVQIRDSYNTEPWSDYAKGVDPKWDWEDCNYRIKPLEFPPLPEGLVWHLPKNLTPKEYEVDKGWRPAVKGEMQTPGYEYFSGGKWSRGQNYDYAADDLNKDCPVRVPISTPFPEPPKKVVMVPLGPEDFVPGSAIRQSKHDVGWAMVETVGEESIYIAAKEYSFQKLADGFYQIKRPGEDWKPCEKPAGS